MQKYGLLQPFYATETIIHLNKVIRYLLVRFMYSMKMVHNRFLSYYYPKRLLTAMLSILR